MNKRKSEVKVESHRRRPCKTPKSEKTKKEKNKRREEDEMNVEAGKNQTKNEREIKEKKEGRTEMRMQERRVSECYYDFICM